MIKFAESPYKGTVIKVVGIGGCGSNAVSYMMKHNLENVTTFALNTDAQHLLTVNADKKIVLGKKITGGHGTGGDPNKGRMAMEETIEEIKECLKDSDLVFLTAGLGGGTGTGGIPVLANVLKEMNILTVSVVTKPFTFEGKKRIEKAEKALLELKDKVNTLLVIPNDKLLQGEGKIRIEELFAKADHVLYQAVKGVVDIITKPGYINVDFADVKTILSLGGRAIMGVGKGKGDKRGFEAIKSAISSHLVEEVDIRKAKGMLINVVGKNVTSEEIYDIFNYVHEQLNGKDEIEIIAGLTTSKDLPEEELEVIVIAAGINDEKTKKKEFEAFPEINDEESLLIPAFLRKQKREEKSKVDYSNDGDFNDF